MGEGVYAYCIEYKTMMMTLLSSSLSLVYLHCVLATSLTATRSCSPIESFVVLGPCVHVIVIHGHWSFDSHCLYFTLPGIIHMESMEWGMDSIIFPWNGGWTPYFFKMESMEWGVGSMNWGMDSRLF